jgi:hypothetical protein
MSNITMPFIISESSGDTAKFIAQRRESSYDLLQSSNELGLSAKGVLQQLSEIFEECSHDGWDGGNAKGISSETMQNALKLLSFFPLGIEAPDIGAEADGAITLEWYRSPDKVISMSINPGNLLYYAAIIGTKRRHGMDFILTGVSEDLLELISFVIGKTK